MRNPDRKSPQALRIEAHASTSQLAALRTCSAACICARANIHGARQLLPSCSCPSPRPSRGRLQRQAAGGSAAHGNPVCRAAAVNLVGCLCRPSIPHLNPAAACRVRSFAVAGLQGALEAYLQLHLTITLTLCTQGAHQRARGAAALRVRGSAGRAGDVSAGGD